MITEVNKSNFDEEILKSTGIIIVDMWAEWCQPCRMLSVIIDEINEEYPGCNICKINIDDEKELAIDLGIMSIPTLLVYKDGEQIDKLVGLRSKEEILELWNPQ